MKQKPRQKHSIGVWDEGDVLQHPRGHGDFGPKDVCVDLLMRKLCPVHLTPLVLREEIRLGEEYTRLRYGCLSCHCVADFVDDELKSDSVGKTLEHIELLIKDVREFRPRRTSPVDSDVVSV